MPAGRRRLDWKAVLGIAISLLLLYWVLRDVDAAEVAHEIRRAHPGWLLAAAAAATATIALRSWRWKPLLRPVLARSAFRSRNAATFIGFMANNLLPARVGEFARAYALARLEPVSVSASFASLVVERLFDALSVIVLLLIAVSLPGFPADAGGTSFGPIVTGLLAFVAAVTVVLFGMLVFPHGLLRLVERTVARMLPASFRRPLLDALRAFIDGLEVLRSPLLLAQIAFGSAVVWGVSALTFWFGFLAFDIDAPLAAALFLQSTIALAVAIPSAPGFFGLFEGAARVGLVNLWGVEVNKAIGYAIGIHIAGFVPVTVIGLIYLWRLGLSWSEVEASEEVVEDAVEHEHPGEPV